MRFIKKLEQKNKDYASSPPVVAAFLGDSITHGCFEIFLKEDKTIDCIYDHEAVYHNQLKKELAALFPAAPLNVINAGVSGGNLGSALLRMERDVLRFCPDMAVICFGLNDAVLGGAEGVPVYKARLSEIVGKFIGEKVETILMTPNMMNTYVRNKITDENLIAFANKTAYIQNSGIMDMYMNVVLEVGNRYEVPVCDCYAKWKMYYAAGIDITTLLSNHINHPVREQHKVFSDAILQMLLKGGETCR